jgi:NADH-quinone oxidoreductase subunit J
MEFKTFLFYAFSVILIFAALRVVTERNPVHAALFLVLSFFSAASLWMLLKAEFLAIVLVLVYVMVLFLFVVMMVDIDIGKLREGFWSHFPLAAIVGAVIVLEMSAVLLRGFLTPDTQVPAASATIGNTKELGKVIFTEYVYAFEIAAIVLLVAIVAAVALTLRRRKDIKYFDPAAAVKVKSTDRVRIVKMKAESDRADQNAKSSASGAESKGD